MKIDSNQVMRESPIVTESRKSNPMTPQIQQSPTKSTSLATTPTWYTTQAVLLQSLGFIYFVAFLSAYYQNEGLMGEHGLMPAKEYWDAIRQKHSSSSALTWWQQFQQYPCIFWWTELNDWSMRSLTLVGLTMSALVTLNRQFHVMLQFFLLWLLYFSIVTVSGHTSFYSYGWESQLLETGFLAIFLCPNAMELQWVATTPSTPPRPPFPLILWLFRWLSFRISIGAGLIKIRGDSCWTQKTCLFYHFETQPIPSPTSFFFHFLPSPILKHAVDLDLFVQVYTSWMVLLPTYIPKCPKLSQGCLQIVRWGGWIQVAFMVNIILSGNLGFLPHLTIVPALACYDDACWPNWLAPYAHHPPIPNFEEEKERRNNRHSMALLTWVKPRLLVNYAYALLVLYLSQPVVINLLQLGGGRQQMNASFDPFRLVNTYGAFGSVGKQRYEPIVSITYDPLDGVGADRSNDTAVEWIELEFPCKPGNLYRRPCFCAPYHYRLDWNIWFLGFKPHQAYLNRRETWLYSLLTKLLSQEEATDRPWINLLDSSSSAKLLRENYDIHGLTPRYAKVDMYHYTMAAPLWEIIVPRYLVRRERPNRIQWWNRTYEENLIPVVALGENGRLYRV